jgi:hypothetical protein
MMAPKNRSTLDRLPPVLQDALRDLGLASGPKPRRRTSAPANSLRQFIVPIAAALVIVFGVGALAVLSPDKGARPASGAPAASGLALLADPPTPAPTDVPMEPGYKVDQTGYAKGIYISRGAMGNAGFMERMHTLFEETELNAAVLDYKGDRGLLSFPSEVPLAKEIRADAEPTVKDPQAYLQWFKDRNITTIARIVVFKDNILAAAYPSWAVTDAATGRVWKDHEGMGWVDPALHAVWDYNIALAEEASRLGFDEIQFDYVRFPTDGAVGRATFALPNTYENRTAAISGLLAKAHAALQPLGVKLGADVFGYTTWVDDDMGIGQDLEVIAPHLDILSPMVYPSTYASGLPGEAPAYRNAIAYPYEIVNKSTDNAVQRVHALNPALEVRPWIQDFQDYAFDQRIYTPQEIRAQMDGARDAGGRGWLLWDPAVKYTRSALGSAEPRSRPNPAGQVLVVAYGDVAPAGEGPPGSVTPEQLRADLEKLLAAGYYPANLRDLVIGQLSSVPAGKRPVILTFDGSPAGQFRLLGDGMVDPATAAGVLKSFGAEHPADWPLRGTFFVRQAVGQPGDEAFGKADLAAYKMNRLLSWGMEVGAMPLGAERLEGLDDAEVQRRLGLAQSQLESTLGGYKVVSLALQAGDKVRNPALLQGGTADGVPYAYLLAATASGALSPSPHSPEFSPMNVARVAGGEGLDRWLQALAPAGAGFVSAGE